jgi:hypothetical protein
MMVQRARPQRTEAVPFRWLAHLGGFGNDG